MRLFLLLIFMLTLGANAGAQQGGKGQCTPALPSPPAKFQGKLATGNYPAHPSTPYKLKSLIKQPDFQPLTSNWPGLAQTTSTQPTDSPPRFDFAQARPHLAFFCRLEINEAAGHIIPATFRLGGHRHWQDNLLRQRD